MNVLLQLLCEGSHNSSPLLRRHILTPGTSKCHPMWQLQLYRCDQGLERELSSVTSDSLWPHGLQHTRLSVHHQLLELAQTHVHSVGDTIKPSHPLSSPSPLPSSFPSIRVFSNESVFSIRWPKVWSFRFSLSPSNEYSGLISFSSECFDLLVVQGTLKGLLQHHKVSILWCSTFFMV